MVKLVQHLRLVEWQVTIIGTNEDVPLPSVAVCLQLLRHAEVVGVVGHVKERFERQPPGIFFRLAVCSFAPEHRHTPIDGLSKLGISLGTEDRAVASVGVEKQEITLLQRKKAELFRELGEASYIE